MTESKCPADCKLNLSRENGVALLASDGPSLEETWLSGGLAVLDPEGRILSANDALAVWVRQPAAGLKGQVLPKLLGQRHAEWGESLEQFLAGAAAVGPGTRG